MAATDDVIQRGTRVQLPFRHAGEDRIAVLDARLIDDPCKQVVAGKSRRDLVGAGIDIVTFITMRPPGASRARIASQVSRSNSSLNSKPGPPTSIAMPS